MKPAIPHIYLPFEHLPSEIHQECALSNQRTSFTTVYRIYCLYVFKNLIFLDLFIVQIHLIKGGVMNAAGKASDNGRLLRPKFGEQNLVFKGSPTL